MASSVDQGVGEQDLGEMVLRVKERSSEESLGADGQSLAEHAHDTLPTNDDSARAEQHASVIEEQEEAAKKAARRAGRMACTSNTVIRAKKDQAERERPAGSRRVTFDVRRARISNGVEQGKGYILFFSCMKRYGGPFAFLSNFYPSKFRVEKVHASHEFIHLEQFYQYCKACAFILAPEIFVDIPGISEPQSSHSASGVVLFFTSAVDTADFVREFIRCATEQHPGWSAPREEHWKPGVSWISEMGLKAKFDADENLMDLLQKTGNYELAQASGDKKFCIGFVAAVAFDHRDEWEDNKDCNLLGQALMKVRDAGRSPAHSKVFDREY